MEKIKAFFAKVWQWILAHKLVSGIIGGVAAAGLIVAIAVPVAVANSNKHTHVEGEHGFCSCGAYLHETYHFGLAEEFTDEDIWKVIDSGDELGLVRWAQLEQGATRMFRIAGGHNHHDFDLNDWDAEDIANDMKVYVRNNEGQFVFANILADNNSIELYDDGHLYVEFTNSGPKQDCFLQIYERHSWNEAGVCRVEGNENPHMRGTPATGKVENINMSANSTAYYRKSMGAGHKVQTQGWVDIDDTVDIDLYYVDAEHAAHVLQSSTVIPEGVNKIYATVKTHDVGITNGKFEIGILEHPVGNGWCAEHEEPTGTQLNAGIAEPVDAVKGETYHFYYIVTTETKVTFVNQMSGEPFDPTDPNYRAYAVSAPGTLVPLEPDFAGSTYVRYSTSGVQDYDIILFEFTALETAYYSSFTVDTFVID